MTKSVYERARDVAKTGGALLPSAVFQVIDEAFDLALRVDDAAAVVEFHGLREVVTARAAALSPWNEWCAGRVDLALDRVALVDRTAGGGAWRLLFAADALDHGDRDLALRVIEGLPRPLPAAVAEALVGREYGTAPHSGEFGYLWYVCVELDPALLGEWSLAGSDTEWGLDLARRCGDLAEFGQRASALEQWLRLTPEQCEPPASLLEPETSLEALADTFYADALKRTQRELESTRERLDRPITQSREAALRKRLERLRPIAAALAAMPTSKRSISRAVIESARGDYFFSTVAALAAYQQLVRQQPQAALEFARESFSSRGAYDCLGGAGLALVIRVLDAVGEPTVAEGLWAPLLHETYAERELVGRSQRDPRSAVAHGVREGLRAKWLTHLRGEAPDVPHLEGLCIAAGHALVAAGLREEGREAWNIALGDLVRAGRFYGCSSTPAGAWTACTIAGLQLTIDYPRDALRAARRVGDEATGYLEFWLLMRWFAQHGYWQTARLAASGVCDCPRHEAARGLFRSVEVLGDETDEEWLSSLEQSAGRAAIWQVVEGAPARPCPAEETLVEADVLSRLSERGLTPWERRAQIAAALTRHRRSRLPSSALLDLAIAQRELGDAEPALATLFAACARARFGANIEFAERLAGVGWRDGVRHALASARAAVFPDWSPYVPDSEEDKLYSLREVARLAARLGEQVLAEQYGREHAELAARFPDWVAGLHRPPPSATGSPTPLTPSSSRSALLGYLAPHPHLILKALRDWQAINAEASRAFIGDE